MKKKVLFIGLSCPAANDEIDWTHLPLIEILPRPFQNEDIQEALAKQPLFTHTVFTSKTAVDLWLEKGLKVAETIAVGKATAKRLFNHGVNCRFIAENEDAEGVVELLSKLKLDCPPHFFWPRSALARSVIPDFLFQKNWPLTSPILYDIGLNPPKAAIDFDQYDGIFFSSPSTVDAFSHFFGAPKKHLKLYSQGKVTEAKLKDCQFCSFKTESKVVPPKFKEITP